MSGRINDDGEAMMLEFYRSLTPGQKPVFFRAMEDMVAGVPAGEAWLPLARALGWSDDMARERIRRAMGADAADTTEDDPAPGPTPTNGERRPCPT